MARTPRRKDLSSVIRRRLRPSGGRSGNDGGMTIIEICVAAMILSMVLIGILGSMGSGLSLVGQGRQRSSATEVAQRELEKVHTLPYVNVGLNATPSHSIDASNPDYWVTGSSYDPDGAGPQAAEPLDVDASGLVTPSDPTPTTVGTTQFTIYRFVTWVDDPTIASTACPPPSAATTCDYKRAIVDVVWANPVRPGSVNSVTESTYVTDGRVSLSQTVIPPVVSPTPTVDHLAAAGAQSAITGQGFQLTISAMDGSGSPVTAYTGQVHVTSTDPTAKLGGQSLPQNYTFAAGDAGSHQFNVIFNTSGAQTITVADTANASLATTTPTISVTSPPCPGDAIAPSNTSVAFTSSYTKLRSISVQVKATDTGYGVPCVPISVDLSNDQQSWTTVGTVTSGVLTSVPWPLSAGDGAKTVYARFRDGNGNQSSAVATPTQIVLDTTLPTTPGTPVVTACVVSGNNKGITLTWAPSVDQNFMSYQVTRVDVTSPSTTTFTTSSAFYADTTAPLLTQDHAYSYSVIALDRAGWTSASSPALTVTFSKKVGLC